MDRDSICSNGPKYQEENEDDNTANINTISRKNEPNKQKGLDFLLSIDNILQILICHISATGSLMRRKPTSHRWISWGPSNVWGSRPLPAWRSSPSRTSSRSLWWRWWETVRSTTQGGDRVVCMFFIPLWSQNIRQTSSRGVSVFGFKEEEGVGEDDGG